MREVRIHRKFCSENLKGDVVDYRGIILKWTIGKCGMKPFNVFTWLKVDSVVGLFVNTAMNVWAL
jgi:hypothetical protein